RGHREVEFRQGLVVEIEAAVAEDVDFGSGEEVEAIEFPVEIADLRDLGQQPGFIEAAGLEGGLRVIGDAEVLQAEIAGGGRHFPEGGAAVRGGGVAVEGAAEVLQLDEARQS